ncbi:hypothetical protein SAMD00019534_063770, partial [Acytostelium subglobosum LB1]|uniref:hypothetical protein n=1 Tax=Acytostelium subglobosum LB1 TaxID=1410327 RepID=UPI0006448D4C
SSSSYNNTIYTHIHLNEDIDIIINIKRQHQSTTTITLIGYHGHASLQDTQTLANKTHTTCNELRRVNEQSHVDNKIERERERESNTQSTSY